MTVKVTDNLPKWLREEKKRQDAAMQEVANDVLIRARMNAPIDSGKLVASGRVKQLKDGSYTVVFGDGSVKYAQKRHYENKKNPQTTKYLEKAGDTVKRGNVKKYFR